MSVAAAGARAALLLAAPDDNIPPGQGPEWGKAAPIGLLIILLLGLSLFFLIKNMNKQFRKVPDSFDPPTEDAVGPVDPESDVSDPRVAEPDVAELDGVWPDGAGPAVADPELTDGGIGDPQIAAGEFGPKDARSADPSGPDTSVGGR